jgi:hypothetical protein
MRMERNWNPCTLLVSVKCAAAKENIWRFLKELKVKLPYNPRFHF